MKTMHRGFTLIELLIVVAIIAILAAIAVPNFLEAQTRSKFARVQADQRTIATAMEAYYVDANKYAYYNHPLDYAPAPGQAIAFVPVRLTTPVAYISTLPDDTFPGGRAGLAVGQHRPFFYMHNYAVSYLGKNQHANHIPEHYRSLTGQDRAVMWEIWSFGVDLDDDHGVVLYDPSNGTISSGDMMRFGP